MNHNCTNERFCLDPAKFPKRLDLDLSDEVIAMIERRAAQTGRFFSEVVTDLLSKETGD